jgi:hypothetical protein
MPTLNNALVGLALLGAVACATKDGDGSSRPEVVTEGKVVYVLRTVTEEEARAPAVSLCRARGGNAVFGGVVQYHRHDDTPPYRTVLRAAQFDCTN